MLFARDKGRMCNNLLQYGHVYAWARSRGRRAVSMRFAYKYPYFRISRRGWHTPLVYALAKAAAATGLLPVATFDHEGANPEAERLMERRRWVVVEGWQVRYYDLFLRYRAEIAALFAFRPRVRRRAEAALAALPAGQARLGLHVRRGDYRTWQGGRYLYPDEVYIDCARRFQASRGGGPLAVVVAGGDPTLRRDAYREALEPLGVTLLFAEGSPGEDLCLLSECDCIMGPPSTFSLVAAMYHDRPLCHIMRPPLGDERLEFGRFAEMFRHIV